MKIVNTEREEKNTGFPGLEDIRWTIAELSHPTCGSCGSSMAFHLLVRPDGREEQWGECEECGAKAELD